MVRIVGGRARGTEIDVPKDAPTRPTTDRVREALFNVLAHRFNDVCRGAMVLDLFAGSGALGLEALSRGSVGVDFVDSDRGAIRQVESNARRVGGSFSVHQKNAAHFLRGPCKAYDLVFLDPPYGQDLIEPCLATLSENGWLKPNAVLCIEQAHREKVTFPPPYTESFERRYGKTTIMILSYCPEGMA